MSVIDKVEDEGRAIVRKARNYGRKAKDVASFMTGRAQVRKIRGYLRDKPRGR